LTADLVLNGTHQPLKKVPKMAYCHNPNINEKSIAGSAITMTLILLSQSWINFQNENGDDTEYPFPF
jgi:hypothetical protein